MCDHHDKRLRFFYVFFQLSLANSVVVLIFVTFWLKMAVFRISQKYSLINRNLKFPNILTLLCNTFQPFRPLLLFLCCVGRLRCGRVAHSPERMALEPVVVRLELTSFTGMSGIMRMSHFAAQLDYSAKKMHQSLTPRDYCRSSTNIRRDVISLNFSRTRCFGPMEKTSSTNIVKFCYRFS